jgi:hypothetical protein
MRFAITGVVAEDVSATLDRVANPFADAFREQLATTTLTCKAGLLVYSPLIMPPSLPNVKNESAYRPRESGFMVCRNIAHQLWMSSTPKQRLRLYADALSAGLGELSQKALPASDLLAIRAAIDRATSEVEQHFSQ